MVLLLLFTTLSVAGEFVKHFTRCRFAFSSFIHQLQTEIRGKRIKWEIIDKYSISGCNGRNPLYIALIIEFLLQFCVQNEYAAKQR